MFFALAASSLLFSACSSDDAVVSTEGQNEAVQQIVLHVASSGDGLTTRAGRPLYSSQALQTIQNVRVLIYKTDNTKAIVKDAKLNWKESSKYDNHGRQLTLTFKGADRLEAGSYKVMAVGYSDNSDYNYSLDVAGKDPLTGKTYSNDITATLKEGKKDAEEVFAGDAALTIGDDQKITNLTSGEEDGLDVTLHRQVAGSFGYFCNIPAKVGGKTAKTLRLVVRGKNDKLTFNNFNSSFTTTGNTIKYYVNGSTSTGEALATTDKFSNGDNGYVLYSIDLKKWFPQLDENGDGVLNAQDASWKRPDDVKTQVVKGSVFGSNFVIPFNYAEGKSTMELQLLDAAGDIIKHWTVSIPAADVNTDATNGNVADVSPFIFNVVRNHMYNLGVKISNGTPTDPDPSNPTPDPDPKPTPDPGKDEPEDLTKSQNLILKVNDNWEAIHKMELGD